MKLLSLEIGERFRSLDQGFKIDFRSGFDGSDEETEFEIDFKALNEFQPFCFAGLNGSGKSNVLEALAAIFYHLELCVAKFKPKSFDKYFRREKCSPDVFELRYLIHIIQEKGTTRANVVTISKRENKEPVMLVEEYGRENAQILGISLQPSKHTNEKANGKIYLPDIVAGYSSGENEILSLPFIKNRLIHFDEYKEAVIKNLSYPGPETSLIYIDSEMSQAVLLSVLLFENSETLKPLEKELKIKGLRSFRINLNKQRLVTDIERKIWSPILDQLSDKILKLKSCSTSWFEDDQLIWMDFYINGNSKTTFQQHFKNSFELFSLFRIFYELNALIVSESIKEEVYSSKGYYTDGKLPVGSPSQNVFHFLDYMILKDVGENEPIELLLRNFSDGEHQFLHTMGICLMLKDLNSLLLLDEPETHYNPNWRAKFIDLLNESIIAGGGNNLTKEVILTSHSPFIISDCLPNNVVFFQKDSETNKTKAIKASEKGIKTYGSDVNYIMKNLFDTNLVSSKSSNELQDIINRGNLNELLLAIDSFGESSQKQFLFKKIYELKNFDDDNPDNKL
jgi:restriction system-associated AAA family ATPase